MKPVFILLVLTHLLFACHRGKYTEATALYEKGKRLERLDSPDSAIHVYRKAADLLVGSKEDELMGEIHNQLGDLLLDNGVYDRAFDAHKKAFEYGQLLEDKTQASRAYRGMGKNFFLRKKAKEALAYFLKALQFENKIEDNEERSSIYNNLSNAYCVLEQYEKALDYSTKAIQTTEDSLKIYRNYSVKGKLYNLLQQYDSARHYLLLGSQSKNIRTQVSCLFKMAEMPLESGLTDSMRYKYLNEAQVLNDSIEDMSKAVKIAETEYLHQLAKLKNEGNSKLMLVVFFSLILILSVLLYLYHKYKYRTKIYQKKINLLYTDFEGKIDERISDNNNREKLIIAIANKTGNTCVANFITLPFYKELKNKLKLETCTFTYAEQSELQTVIFKEFDIYIQQISNIINLSSNDSLLCCLSLLGFSTKKCAVCRGVSNETIRSQRTRIKKKIPKTFLDNGLFNVIFREE